jgi:ABC-type phosphate transport system permease subunit
MPKSLVLWEFLLSSRSRKALFIYIAPQPKNFEGGLVIAFFNSAVGVLQTLVIALGAGLGVWGVINLLEEYGNDNPSAMHKVNKEAEHKQHTRTAAPPLFRTAQGRKVHRSML